MKNYKYVVEYVDKTISTDSSRYTYELVWLGNERAEILTVAIDGQEADVLDFPEYMVTIELEQGSFISICKNIGDMSDVVASGIRDGAVSIAVLRRGRPWGNWDVENGLTF